MTLVRSRPRAAAREDLGGHGLRSGSSDMMESLAVLMMEHSLTNHPLKVCKV